MITPKTMDRRTVLATLAGALAGEFSCRQAAGPLSVGWKDCTEQRILGEVIAQHIEHRLGGQVRRTPAFEGTRLINDALMAHQIDLYPEYSGTEVRVVIDEAPDSDPAIVLERVHRYLEQRRMVTWLDPLGFDSPFAISVPGSIARQYAMETLDDAGKNPSGWAMATSSEFFQRADGYAALMRTYGIRLRAVADLQPADNVYGMVDNGHADMVAGYLTDGALVSKDMVVLKDVRKAFAPNVACIAVRNDALAAYPRLRSVLSELSGKFTADLVRKLNAEVDEKRRDPHDAAARFLQSAGLA